jgi:hypothetical protein
MLVMPGLVPGIPAAAGEMSALGRKRPPLAACSAILQRAHLLSRKARMAASDEINAHMLAFWKR